jgi:hypothetical protein
LIANSPRLKRHRAWNRWNAFQRWLRSKGEFPTGQVGTGEIDGEWLRSRYSNLSGAELEEFETYREELSSGVTQKTGLAKVNTTAAWRKVAQDLNRAVSNAEVLGGHVFAVAVGKEWHSKASVYGTVRGLAWTTRLDELDLGHVQFAQYARTGELNDYIDTLQSCKIEIERQHSPYGDIQPQPNWSPSPFIHQSIPPVRRAISAIPQVQRAMSAIPPVQRAMSAIPAVQRTMSAIPPVERGMSVSTTPLGSPTPPAQAAAAASQGVLSQPPSPRIPPVKQAMSMFDASTQNPQQGSSFRDHNRRYVTGKLIEIFNEHLFPNVTRVPNLPWDGPGNILEKNQLEFELPPGWTLEMVTGQRGKKRTVADINRLIGEFNRQPCRIRLVRKSQHEG